MADNVERVILDDTQFIGALENIIDKTKEADKAFDEMNDEISKGGKKASDDFVKSNKKVNESLDETANSQREAAKATEDAVKNTRILGVSLNDVRERLSLYRSGLITTIKSITTFTALSITQKRGIIGLTAALGGGRKAFILLARAINIAKVALLASGIGAAIVVIGSLAAALTTSQLGMDKLGQASAYVSGAFTVLTDKASKLGESILKMEGGGKAWLAVIAALPPGLQALFIEMDAVGKKMAELTAQFQQLDRIQSDMNVTTAESRAELEQLKRISEDTTKTFEKRIIAVKKGIEIEDKQLEGQITLSKLRLKLLEESDEARKEGDLTTHLKEQNTERERLANLIAESTTKQIEGQNKLNSLEKERSDKLTASQLKLISITKQVVKLGHEVQLITDKESFDFVKAGQIKALQDLQKELKEVAKITGDDVNKQLELLDDTIDGIANTEFVPIIDQLVIKKEFDKLGEEVFNQVESINDSDKVKIKAKIVVAPPEESDILDGIDTFEDLFNELLDEIIDNEKTEGKIKKFLSGIGSLFSEFGNLANEANEIQISNIDKQLDKLSDRREQLQEDLDSELSDQEKGLANNVGNKQTEVDSILAEEERLQVEKEKIIAEGQKRQLIFDTLAQTQSLITSSINIIKGFSQIPIVGLPLGIAAVGSMLAFFAKTKADAFKATKLHTGADRISDHFGFGERYGDTDLPGRGSGYELVNRRTGKRTNTVISGREMILPENVSVSNEQFFNSMRNGLYNGIDLNDAVSFYQAYKGKSQKTNQSASGSKIYSHRKENKGNIQQYIPFTDKRGVQKAILVTINPNDADGNIVIIDK